MKTGDAPVKKVGDAPSLLSLYTADLHIHTCLSPCATLDMTPMKIVREALLNKLSVIAITDHNSAENVSAVIACARDTKLHVIPGMEIASAEEVHIVALFETVEQAQAVQEVVFEHLPPGENDEELFGLQIIANEFDEVERFDKRLLVSATSLSIDHAVSLVHDHQGLVIAAHIDREGYGIIGQLGFIPDYLKLDALEISRRMGLAEARARFAEYSRFPFITSSDAHQLFEVGAAQTGFIMEIPDFAEIKKALLGMDGRAVAGEGR